MREKIRARGFWPLSKEKESRSLRRAPGTRRVVFERNSRWRIANSNCRLCGARGHWRQECPNKSAGSNPNATSAEIHVSTMEGEFLEPIEQEVFDRLPISLEQALPEWWPQINNRMTIPEMPTTTMSETDHGKTLNQHLYDDQVGTMFVFPHFCRASKIETHVNEEFILTALTMTDLKRTLRKGLSESVHGKHVRCETQHEPMFFVDHGSTAIFDTGASKSVIGKSGWSN